MQSALDLVWFFAMLGLIGICGGAVIMLTIGAMSGAWQYAAAITRVIMRKHTH